MEEWTKYVHDTLLLLEGLVACHACIIRIPHPDSVLWLNFSHIACFVCVFIFMKRVGMVIRCEGVLFTGKQMCQTFSVMIPSEMMVYDGFLIFGFCFSFCCCVFIYLI